MRIIPCFNKHTASHFRRADKEGLPRNCRNDHSLFFVIETVARFVNVEHVVHIGRGQLEYKAVLTVLDNRRSLSAQFLVGVPVRNVLRCGNERAVVLSYSLAHRIEEIERDREFRVDIEVRLVRNDKRMQVCSSLVFLSRVYDLLFNKSENEQHLRVRNDVVFVRKQTLEIKVYKVSVRF